MKFKLMYFKPHPYGVTQNQWAFVKRIKGGYRTVGDINTCKDYMHEAICNVIYKKSLHSFSGYSPKAEINLTKFQIVMFFNNTRNKKRHVYSIKRMLNSIEKRCGVSLTKILEIENLNSKKHAFIITADKIYIESPALMHGLFAFFRTMHTYDRIVNIKNVAKILSGRARSDSAVLKFVIENKIMDLLMLNHNKIFESMSLLDIYPRKPNNKRADGDLMSSYHSGFGMVALRSRRFASKKYSARVIKVLDTHKIPKK